MKPTDSDRTRLALKPYWADLNLNRDDAAGCVVEYLGKGEDDQGWLQWIKLNRLITEELGGSWIKPGRYSRGHWRIPK